MFKNRRQQLEIRKIDKYLEDSAFVKPEEWQSHQQSLDFKTRILNFLNSQLVSIFMGLLTIYTIFATDIDRSFLPAQASYYISSIHLVAIGIFVTQIILLSISQEGYFLKFYFWIDLMSTLTMFLEIIWIENLLSAEGNIKVAISLARVTKASRLSKVGAKAFKIMKLVRLFKLMKVVEKKQQQKSKEQTQQQSVSISQKMKTNTQMLMPTDKHLGQEQIVLNRLQDPNPSRKLIALRKRQRSSLRLDVTADIMKVSKKKRQQHFMILNLDKCISLPPLQRKNVNQQLLQQVEQKWKQLNDKQQNSGKKNQIAAENTKVGAILKQAIQKNIVIMIVGLIIIIPTFSADTWFDENAEVPSTCISMFNDINTLVPDVQKSLIDAYINIQVFSQLPLLQIVYPLNSTCCNFPQNYPDISHEDINQYRDTQLMTATDDIYTVIISKQKLIQLGSQLNLGRGLFITLLLIFASILYMKDIEKYALNPLQKMAETVTEISENPFEIIKKIQEQQEQDEQQSDQTLQTKVLQGMIIKISSLLTIGTGQNGTKIITKSLSKKQLYDSHSVQNKKFLCVFLYISITHYQLISEHLDDEMISYINILTEIIHEISVKNGGIPCQNDGSGFLICWKIDNVNEMADEQENKMNFLRNFNDISISSTLALQALIQISLRLEKSQEIKQLLETGEQFEDIFSSKIYASLHIGQGILGAIGSNFKIDSKFFGQDVLFTKQLNSYTRNYSISNLMSEELYNVLNSSAKEKCRKVDIIKVERYDSPIQLYTLDMHFEGMVQQIPRNPQTSIHKYINSIYKERQMKRQQVQRISFSFLQARRFYDSGDFYDNWTDGFEKYFEGDWISAESYFRNCYYMTDPYYDKPSEIFVQRIKKNEGFPPEDWDKVNQLPKIKE